MKVQVYKCRFTGKLFDLADRDKYVNHLLALRGDMKERRLEDRMKKAWATWIKAEKKKITHPDQIVPWFLENQKKIMATVNARATGSISSHDKFSIKTDEFTKLVLDIKWDPNCSNSHRAPDGKPYNWCQKDLSLPTGYPGWKGRLSGCLKRISKHNGAYPYGDAYKLVGIKTGGGGGGNDNHSYDVTIFLDDWPGLRQEVRRMEEEEIIGRLRGTK